MQSYAALLAFIYANGLNEKTVLLIDEAESHLHVDAQVSLVDTFIQQTLVGKIIYTTHSPACLPPDIGNAIKAVVPNADDNFRSNVTGDLLSLSKGGVFPLSFAMGAMTAAMSAFRAAVIVEGPSDAILMPTLIKKVIGESNLLYRIVPGLAQTNPELYREYESMALHVIYVVDGDRDGVKYAEGLKECGVQKSRIIMLDEGMVLEDLVDRESYVNAYEQVVQDAASANRRSIPVQALDEDASFRIQAMKEWCEKNGVGEPSKPAVAYKLIEDADNLVVSDAGVEVLRRIHNTVVSELG